LQHCFFFPPLFFCMVCNVLVLFFLFYLSLTSPLTCALHPLPHCFQQSCAITIGPIAGRTWATEVRRCNWVPARSCWGNCRVAFYLFILRAEFSTCASGAWGSMSLVDLVSGRFRGRSEGRIESSEWLWTFRTSEGLFITFTLYGITSVNAYLHRIIGINTHTTSVYFFYTYTVHFTDHIIMKYIKWCC
jgi:hypothetical protein